MNCQMKGQGQLLSAQTPNPIPDGEPNRGSQLVRRAEEARPPTEEDEKPTGSLPRHRSG
jgi:hypothetical protein